MINNQVIEIVIRFLADDELPFLVGRYLKLLNKGFGYILGGIEDVICCLVLKATDFHSS